jgi:hypothetical protein
MLFAQQMADCQQAPRMLIRNEIVKNAGGRKGPIELALRERRDADFSRPTDGVPRRVEVP